MPINSLQSFMATQCSAAEKCCLKVFKIQQREYPRDIFSLGSKFKFLTKSPHLVGNFLLNSDLKTVFRRCQQFFRTDSLKTSHFWAKKHAIQQGGKSFFVSDFFETYVGLTPSTPITSLQSFMAMRCSAVEKCCHKVFKIQQRGTPGKCFAWVKIKFFTKSPHLDLVGNFLLNSDLKPFSVALNNFPTMIL